MALLRWGEWRPDVSDYLAEYSRTIENVLPRGDGYGPAQGFAAFTGALPDQCRGFYAALKDDGSLEVFGGTATRLYILDQSDLTWTDVSKTDSAAMDLSGAAASAYIGDMTAGGGSAASFDTDTTEAHADCSQSPSGSAGWVGVTFTTPTQVRSAVIHGSNNAGFVNSSNPATTITLYGKTGTAPANGTDGTSLGSVAFTDTADESTGRSITSSDLTTEWDHVWVNIVHEGAASIVDCAEVRLTGADNYATAAGFHWQFAQMGSILVATNQNDDVQTWTLGSSAVFSNLAGSPPKASYVTVISEHIILSGLVDEPFSIAWSARSDPTGWTAGTDGSDIQSFPDGGVVRGVAGGEFDGLVFQDNTIRRLNYVAGTFTFEISRITNDKGLRAPYSLVRAAGNTFFLSASGFEMISPSGVPVPIGKERFDRTFFEDWDDGRLHLTFGVADPQSTRVYWFYKSAGFADNDLFNRAIVWDWALERGSFIDDIQGEFAATIGQPGVTLESLDDISASIDDLELSLDDILASLGTQLAIANPDHRVGFLTGDVFEARLETPDVVMPTRVFVRKSRPITDASTVYGLVKYRQKSADLPQSSTENLMNDVGFVPHRIDTRHARFRNRIPAETEWSYSMGVDPDFVSTGQR
jgi:hypothetical protein